jgi:hypothetical protein
VWSLNNPFGIKKFLKVSKSFHKFPQKLSTSYHQLITLLLQNYYFITTQLSSGDHPVKVYHKVTKSCQKLQKVTKSYKKLPEVPSKLIIELSPHYHKITSLLSLNYHPMIIW